MQKSINTQKDVIMALLESGRNVPAKTLRRLGVSYTQRIAEIRRDADDYVVFTNKTSDGKCYRLWKQDKPAKKCSKSSCRR